MTAPADTAALPSRLAALFVVRLVIAMAVLAAAATGHVGPAAVTITAGYLLASVAGEALRQARGRLARAGIDAALLVDGVFVAMVVTLGGGLAGELAFLLYVHIVAVTLLASYRTGLKAAVWQSLLLVVAYHLPPSITGAPAPDVPATAMAVAAFLGVAIVTAGCSSLNERALRRGRSGFQTLATMAHDLQSVAAPAGVAPALIAAVPQVLAARRVALYLAAERTLVVADDAGVRSEPAVCDLDAAVVAAWEGGTPVLRRRLAADADPAIDAALPDARNVVVVPMAAEGRPVGALVVEHGGGPKVRVDRSTLTLLTQLAAHAALVHRNLRLLAEVRHRAAVDPLTGLANRRTFSEALGREIARARRTGDPLSLVLLDIDHFKLVNDRHGHQVGDEVLRHVGGVLLRSARAVDVPARFGGEEFAVLLPACPRDEAVRVAQRLRAGIAASGPLALTASAGVASLEATDDAASLVAAADAALYGAKTAGRDRVAAAGAPAGV